MSYAAVAASGPKQSPEEVLLSRRMFLLIYNPSPSNIVISRAPPVPTLEHSESETASLIDVDSPHVSSVRSDFEDQAVKTETQAARLEHEAEDKARAEARKVEAAAKDVKEKAEEKAKQAKAAAKKEANKLKENQDNPVYIANAVIWGVGAVALGIGAYQKHTKGQLDAKLAGSVVAAIGAFAVADYFGSQWLLANKYPTK